MELNVYVFLAVIVLCVVMVCLILGIKSVKSKKKRMICLGIVLLLILCGVVGWRMPRALVRQKHLDKVTEIRVYSGSTGNCVKITDKNEIRNLYTALSETKIKNTVDMTTGYQHRIMILDGDKELYDFFIKSEKGGKSGMLTGYKVVEGDGGYRHLEMLLENGD